MDAIGKIYTGGTRSASILSAFVPLNALKKAKYCPLPEKVWNLRVADLHCGPNSHQIRSGAGVTLLGDYIVMWAGFCNDDDVYLLDTKQVPEITDYNIFSKC